MHPVPVGVGYVAVGAVGLLVSGLRVTFAVKKSNAVVCASQFGVVAGVVQVPVSGVQAGNVSVTAVGSDARDIIVDVAGYYT